VTSRAKYNFFSSNKIEPMVKMLLVAKETKSCIHFTTPFFEVCNIFEHMVYRSPLPTKF